MPDTTTRREAGQWALSAAQRDQLSRDGFLKLPGRLPDALLAPLRDRLHELLSGDGDAKINRQVEPALAKDAVAAEPVKGPLRKLHYVARWDAVFHDFLTSAPVLAILSSVLGDGFVLYSDIAFLKAARVGSRQPYHQDRVLGYEIDDAARMVGLWVALDPATEANGCLRFIPGSHRLRLQLEETALIEKRAVGDGVPEEVLVPAEPGEVILIDSLVLHCSQPNTTGQDRWAYSAFCVSADAKYFGGEEQRRRFVRLRGEPIPGRI